MLNSLFTNPVVNQAPYFYRLLRSMPVTNGRDAPVYDAKKHPKPDQWLLKYFIVVQYPVSEIILLYFFTRL